MSLIIKGSIMPLMCGDCPCYDGSDYACNATGRGVIEYRYDGRPDNCPIVEIPTPHGRLIDADEHIKSLRDGFCGERCRRNHDCFNCGIDGYIRIVENEPTVLEAEVSE